VRLARRFAPLGSLVVENGEGSRRDVPVDAIDATDQREGLAIDIKFRPQRLFLVLHVNDAPTLLDAVGLDLCESLEPLADLLDLHSDGGERSGAIPAPHEAIELGGKFGLNGFGIVRMAAVGVAELSQDVVQQRTKGQRIKLVNFVRGGLEFQHLLQIEPVGTSEVRPELGHAHFGQRLRTTVDYQDPERRPSRAEPQLVRALEDDTYSLSQQADFSVVVDSRPMLAGVGIVAVLAMAWLVTLVMSPEWRIATGRTLLLPLQYTTVTFTPAEQTIRSGESVDVVAEISGRAIHAAAVRFRPVASDGDGDGEWTTLKLVPPTTDDDPQNSADQAPAAALIGKVAATLADCQQDLEFEVVAGPVPLPLGRVRVLQPLEIKEYQAQATPPEYTGKPVEQFDNWTFKVLEGTHVALQVELSRAASEARLTPVKNKSDKSKSQDSSADPSSAMELRIDGGVLRGDLADLRTSGVWELTAKAADGIELEPQRLAIRVQPDGRAKVRFLEPAEELEVISTAEVPLVMEAADDLALVRIGIACQVANGPMKTLWQQDLAEGTTDQIRGQTTLQLEDFKLTFQDGVTYYAFADDKYFDQERRTSTPLRFIDIRPFKMAYQMLDTGGT